MNKERNYSVSDWVESSLKSVVRKLESEIDTGIHISIDDELNIAGRESVYKILDDYLAVLFPGAFAKRRIEHSNLNFFINDRLRHLINSLERVVSTVLDHHCSLGLCDVCDCEKKIYETCIDFVQSLPKIRTIMAKDIQAAYDGDPAATSLEEIILSYPAIEAIATYRIANFLYKRDIPIIPRIMSERAHSKTGIDINPGAQIGESFFIDHGTGVVIGETCKIGNNVKLYQGVTLGAISPFDKNGFPRKGEKRHPDVEDDVIIYANATILGGKTVIGKGAIIAGNSWITKSVAPGEIATSN